MVKHLQAQQAAEKASACTQMCALIHTLCKTGRIWTYTSDCSSAFLYIVDKPDVSGVQLSEIAGSVYKPNAPGDERVVSNHFDICQCHWGREVRLAH